MRGRLAWRCERSDLVFEPATSTWTELPDDPLPSVCDRHVVVDGDDLLLFGKATAGPIGETPVLGARLDGATGAWQVLPDAPGNGFQAWGIDGVVVLNPHFGAGATGGIFDPAIDTWTTLPPYPDAESWRHDLAGALGSSSAVYEYLSGWVLDVTSGTWIEIPPLDTRSGSSSTAITPVGRGLFAFGGEDWQSSGQEGRLLGDAWLWTPPRPPTRAFPRSWPRSRASRTRGWPRSSRGWCATTPATTASSSTASTA